MSKPLVRGTPETLVAAFSAEFSPLEAEHLSILEDKRTGAQYVECHVVASKLVALATIHVPLDPDEQPEYRANREIVADHAAFQRMKDDAIKGRTFSNIVAEYTKDFDPAHPLKIIGGQHRFQAIRLALEADVDRHHGVKVYLALNKSQRLDVQLISNTNIGISAALFDRMQETFGGPHLREWCQRAGLLELGQDFADHRERGGPITVQLARTFILNYYIGLQVDTNQFDETDTAPIVSKTGTHDPEWEALKEQNPALWIDPALMRAATEFGDLIRAQRQAFAGKKPKPKPDQPEKAVNIAIVAAWAYVAGVLQENETRLRRHYDLKKAGGKRDPLNATELSKGRHRSDADNYRGLGYRSGPLERGRLVELFFLQAEKGNGITAREIDLAIKKHHSKVAVLEVREAEK